MLINDDMGDHVAATITTTTPNYRREPLLMGWKQGALAMATTMGEQPAPPTTTARRVYMGCMMTTASGTTGRQ